MANEYYEGIGRRKESSARVRVMSGSGTITVNEKPADQYFPRDGDLQRVVAPLQLTELAGKMDVTVLVSGGGVSGQVGAVRHGLARALLKMDASFRPALRKAGMLTRDARIKERKKPGLKRARKAPTYTKR